MSFGAKAINKCVHDILDELRAEVEAEDKSAAQHPIGRDRGIYLNDAARGLRLLEQPKTSLHRHIEQDIADLILLIAKNRRVLEACDAKDGDKLAGMKRALLEMDIQIAQKTLEDMKLALKLAAEHKEQPARPWS